MSDNPGGSTGTMIEITVTPPGPELELLLPAEEQSVPFARQAVRSHGRALRAGNGLVQDAELAVTEACANAIEHAYRDGSEGTLEVTLSPRDGRLVVSVLDRGSGMTVGQRRRAEGSERGFGLAIIEGVTRKTEIRGAPGAGTELVMVFDLSTDSSAPPPAPVEETIERIVRRQVAVLSAQLEIPSDRLVEGLLVAELLTRHAMRYLLEGRARIGLRRLERGFDLSIGPLAPGAAEAVVAASDLPAVGPVIDRLADEVRIEHIGVPPERTEQLSVRVLAPARS